MIVVLYLVHNDTLLQNVTDIVIHCDSYFIIECSKSLLQNESGFFVQNATILLQNVTVITKCDAYYKMRRYNVQEYIQEYDEKYLSIDSDIRWNSDTFDALFRSSFIMLYFKR